MKHYLIVWMAFMRMCTQKLIAYRIDFFIWTLVSLGWTIFSLLFYEILFLHTNTLAGWSRQEIMIFIGTYMIIDTATWSLLYGNIKMYAESVFSGMLDFLMIQPIDLQYRLSIQHLSWTQFPRLLIGIFMVATNVQYISFQQLVAYILLIHIGIFIIYLLWFFTTTFTFFAEKLDNITEIVPGLRRIWSIPSDVYTGPVSALLTIIFPVALIGTTPSRVLLGVFAWKEIAILCIFTIIFFLITRWFFRYAVKRYSGVGS